MGKLILRQKGVAPSESEIDKLMQGLKPTKCEKGVIRPKRPAELREEAKRKLLGENGEI